MISIAQLQKQVFDNAVAHGFWPILETKAQGKVGLNLSQINIGEKLMLMVQEIGEAFEWERDNNNGYHYSEVVYKEDKPAKPDGFAIELADCVIRIMDLCQALDIDLEYMIKVKHEYNKTRPFKHGRKC
jgi:NTP pyrophosphatase (non-canonical NTP hydrolase)